MKFYMPTRLYDEPGCVENHAAELSALGTKALIVTGPSSAVKCGALADVAKALQTDYCIFNQVEENPSVETILKATEYGLSEKADFLIGIGGGSPMDAAKAIAFMMHLKSLDPNDLYNPSLPSNALPVVAIPTTCGTGSEVTGVSVLTVHAKNTKMSIPQRIFPKLALIDGKYLLSAPHSIIANTSIDALAHMIESYLMNKADDYNRAIIREGLQIWAKTKDVLAGQKDLDLDAAATLMRASTFAGMAIAQTGTSIPHALSYILTYNLKMPHGCACGYFLGNYLAQANPQDIETILGLLQCKDIEEFKAFLKQALGNPQVPQETLQRAYDVVVQNKARLNGCTFPVDEKILHQIVF